MRGLVVPPSTEDFTADPVELFFDLAFVFAFSQLVAHLVHHPTWEGALEAGLLFLILWFAWSVFTWAANAVQGNAREVRAIFLVATAASVPMGAAVGAAFGSGGGTFAVCAGIIIMMAFALQVWALGGNDASREVFESVLRFSGPNLAGIGLLVLGGFLDGAARTVLWVLFVVVILGTMVAARTSDWIIRPGHFAERHGLIIIIALGEIIVAIGIAVVDSLSESDGLPTDTIVALTTAGILAGLLWWSYFDRVVPALEHRCLELTGRDRAHLVADAYTLFHIFIVGGIIAGAAATEEILLHPRDAVHGEFLVMLVAGFGLFFGGIAAAAYRAYRVLAKERLAAMVAIILLTILGRNWDGVVILIAVDLVLLVTLIAEHRRVEAPSAAVA